MGTRESDDNSRMFRVALRKILNKEELTEDEFAALPEHYRLMYSQQQGGQDPFEEARREYATHKIDQQKKEKARKQSELKRIEQRINEGMEVTQEERELYAKLKSEQKALQNLEYQVKRDEKIKLARTSSKLANMEPLTKEDRDILGHKFLTKNQVKVKATEILDDIITGGTFTLEDVNYICLGAKAAEKDPIEHSVIQLFEKTVESVKKQTHSALNAPETGHFFNNIDADILTRESPLQLNEIVSSSVAGIELLRGDPLDENPAQAAIDSYMKAMVMTEAETKIREAVKNAEHKQKIMDQQKTDEALAEFAAIAGAFSNTLPQDTQNLGFNITEEEFDISFSPSDDPDCYKPLEIISYMAMTNCRQQY